MELAMCELESFNVVEMNIVTNGTEYPTKTSYKTTNLQVDKLE